MHKHHASEAVRAFHQYTAITHHGGGPVWLVLAGLAFIAILLVRGSRRRPEYR